jgi:LPXTG-site transpeptidase (sortase) family protein
VTHWPHLRRAVIVAMAALLGATATAGLLKSPASPAQPPLTGSLPADITGPAKDASASPTGPGPGQTARALPPRAPATPRPSLLLVPRIELTLPVLARGVDRTGAMALPRTPAAVSWYRFGPGPLSAEGATVLAGHVDTAADGAGPLARLGELQQGDRLRVRVGDRLVTYSVTSVTRMAKAALELPALFSRVGAPRLHLVTCGGRYLPDQGGYQDNVIIAAHRTSA